MEQINTKQPQQATTEGKPDFEILNQYTKDFSFEAPSSPQIFFEKLETQPQVDINLEVKTQAMNDDLFEVMLVLKVRNTIADKTIFVIDISYAALAVIHSKDEDVRKRLLTKTVPAHIFPYIRALISDISGASGFAPFILNPIDFEKIVLK